MDFAHDQLSNGQKIKALRVIYLHTQKCLAIDVDHNLRAEHVIAQPLFNASTNTGDTTCLHIYSMLVASLMPGFLSGSIAQVHLKYAISGE